MVELRVVLRDGYWRDYEIGWRPAQPTLATALRALGKAEVFIGDYSLADGSQPKPLGWTEEEEC
jgi:hypothetical protein